MKYKGLEIMQMISKGQIEDGTRFDFENNNFNGEVEYYNGTLYWIRFDENWNETGKKNLFEMFNIQSTMVADFELIEDEIDIDSIEHKELEILQEILGQCDLFKGNEKYILKVINENNSRLVDAVLKVSKENEILLQAVKQLNKEVKELKEEK